MAGISTSSNCAWERPPPRPAAAYDEVHVWRASLDQPEERAEDLFQLLSADERQRAARFHFERDRRRFIAGRGILRSILAGYLDIAASDLRFTYEAQGKPALAENSGGSALRFNLAHSTELALYAVACGRDVGVDLELIHPVPERTQIEEQFFSARERAALRMLPERERLEAFFRCWTRKEALLKAVGAGLTLPLQEIEVYPERETCSEVPRRDDAGEAICWSLLELCPDDGYVAALAVEGEGWCPTCWEWRWSL